MQAREAHKENLRKQIDMTRSTYLAMRKAGYDKQRAISLRFAYCTAPEKDARALTEHLMDTTRYFVVADRVEGGYLVHGHTQPARISAGTLGRWVHWMCRTGYRYGCLFDGWGAQLGKLSRSVEPPAQDTDPTRP